MRVFKSLVLMASLLASACFAPYERMYERNWTFWCQHTQKEDAVFVERCRESLSAALPMHQSFEATAEGRKAKQDLLDLFVRFVYAPLQFPSSEVLGVSISSFPRDLIELRQDFQLPAFPAFSTDSKNSEQINFMILSAIFSHIDEFIYSKEQPTTKQAITVARSQLNYEHYKGIFHQKHKVFLYPFFWNEQVWYKQMAYLFHESYHSIQNSHLSCEEKRGEHCDLDFRGAYGKEIFLLESVLHGADQNQKPLLESEIQKIVLRICEVAGEHIVSLPAPLHKIVNSDSCQHPQLSWIAKQERLHLVGNAKVAVVLTP